MGLWQKETCWHGGDVLGEQALRKMEIWGYLWLRVAEGKGGKLRQSRCFSPEDKGCKAEFKDDLLVFRVLLESLSTPVTDSLSQPSLSARHLSWVCGLAQCEFFLPLCRSPPIMGALYSVWNVIDSCIKQLTEMAIDLKKGSSSHSCYQTLP